MMISKELLVMNRLQAVLSAIVPVTDYHDFTLDGAVFLGRSGFGKETPRPFLSLLESPRPETGLVTGEHGEQQLVDWDMLIQGFVAETDDDNPLTPAYQLMAAVRWQLSRIVLSRDTGSGELYGLYPDDYLLGLDSDGQTILTGLLIGKGVARPPTDQVSPTAFFLIPLTAKLYLGPNPYVEIPDVP